MADTLPGSDLTQDQVDAIIAAGPQPGQTWYSLLFTIHPVGLLEVPIWYSEIVGDALRAGHITVTQAQTLEDTLPDGTDTAPPQSLLNAWDDLMQAMSKTWPKRRQRASAQLLRMNTAVSRAQRIFARG